ncbi:MAG: hypothetical protein HKN05_17535 [Rhizobiales bacterium]|nr:hypothetical protein [Hyphomicrobiales bacterium]
MRTLILGLGLALSLATFAPAGAAEFFVPQGHSYAPGDERIPLLNSQRDRVNARAAEIETEIYRRQLRQRKHLERMNAFEDHQFGDHFQRSNTWD